MIEFIDAGLRLLWTDDTTADDTTADDTTADDTTADDTTADDTTAGERSAPGLPAERDSPRGRPVGSQLAALLRSTAGGALARPARIRAPVRRRLTEPAPAVAEVARAVRVSPVAGGVRVEVETTVPGSAVVSVVLRREQADGLAAVLEDWSRREQAGITETRE